MYCLKTSSVTTVLLITWCQSSTRNISIEITVCKQIMESW